MKKLTLKGRKVVGGVVEGEALVTTDAWAAFMAIDADTGVVTEARHQLRGQSVKGKVLVFPRSKGSSGWSMGAQALRFGGTAPLALVVSEIHAQSACGAIVMRVPTVTGFDQDPTAAIQTGDWVKVDGDRGIVEVTRR
jgi:predicted aconitase with swiveling domain